MGQWFQIYRITYTTIHFIGHYKEPRNIKFYHLLKLVRKLVSTIKNGKWKSQLKKCFQLKGLCFPVLQETLPMKIAFCSPGFKIHQN